jgi:ribonuclease P protein component
MDPNLNSQGSERLVRRHRMRVASDFARVRETGTAFRGTHCLLAVCPLPGEPTRVGFIASRRSVGDAVHRNRARRRLREIVRRRWARMPEQGLLLLFIAYRSSPTAPHQDLACDVERLLTSAGALAPLAAEVR